MTGWMMVPFTEREHWKEREKKDLVVYKFGTVQEIMRYGSRTKRNISARARCIDSIIIRIAEII